MKIWYVALFSASLCFANGDTEDWRRESVHRELEFFYMQPNPSCAGEIIKEIVSLQQPEEFRFYLKALFQKYGNEAFQWCQDAQVIIEDHPILLAALLLAGKNEDAARLAKKNNIVLDEPAKWFPTSIPELFDSCRNTFSISGSLLPIRDMFSCFDSSTEDPYLLEVIHTIGERSLFEAMLYHEKVYRFCVAESKTRTGESKAVLDYVIQAIDNGMKKNPCAHRNGNFGADLIISTDSQFETDWSTVSMKKLPKLASVSSIPYPKNAQTVSLAFLFTCFELDRDLNAHVTFDLEVIDPNGKKMGDFRDQIGLKKRMPSRFLLQCADDLVDVHFSSNAGELKTMTQGASRMSHASLAIPGIYTIHATVKDHIGKKEICWDQKFEILSPE